MKVLVTGAEGMLGRAVMERGAPGLALVGVARADGDLTSPAAVNDLFVEHRPDWVIHCAAFTDVDGAETRRDLALAVNAGATEHLAYACQQSGAGLTYISTDYVFQGDGDGYDESAPRDPVNHYGLTKAKGEQVVEILTVPWQIVRTSWLFGDGAVNFVKTIRKLLGERESLRVVADQTGSPTYAADLAGLLCGLVAGRHSGLFHATNSGACSWFEFARQIALCRGDDPARIRPCSTAEYPTAARRPACSVLRSTALAAAGFDPLPAWEDALARYDDLLVSGRALFP